MKATEKKSYEKWKKVELFPFHISSRQYFAVRKLICDGKRSWLMYQQQQQHNAKHATKKREKSLIASVPLNKLTVGWLYMRSPCVCNPIFSRNLSGVCCNYSMQIGPQLHWCIMSRKSTRIGELRVHFCQHNVKSGKKRSKQISVGNSNGARRATTK